jgi:isoleucyl-tRNA synthetase
MWVAHSDFSRDVQIGPSIVAKVAETLRKIRNTIRFCIANNFDFIQSQLQLLPYSQLTKVMSRHSCHVMVGANE